jgi:hypothetical protein
VLAGEACNLLLGTVGALWGAGVLATPQGRFYLGWVVRQADWQRMQGTPVCLGTPQVPINCLEAAQRMPWVQASDVLQRVNVQKYMSDR